MSVPKRFARLGRKFFETRAARAGFLRQESEEVKLVGRQTGGDERAERGVGAGNGDDRNAGRDGFGRQPAAGIADAGHAGVGDDGDGAARLLVLRSVLWHDRARCARGS